LNQQKQRLHVAAARSGAVFVDNYLVSRLGPAERTY
jgi:hypothetical protein